MNNIKNMETSQWFKSKFSDETILYLLIKQRIYAEKSRFQKIEIIDSYQFGRLLVLDNIINVAEKDEFIYHEMISHVPLFSHPNPKSVLVVGGGDGGTARELVKHPSLAKVDMVEIDPQVVAVSKKFFSQVSCSLDDPRIKIIYDDAFEYIQSTSEIYDIIIIDSTDPVGTASVLFSLEFYTNCFNKLKEDGILTAQSESPFYDFDIVEGIYRNNKKLFPIVRMYTAFVPSYVSGMWSFLFSSKKYDPVENFQFSRFHTTALDTKYYNAEIHRASFALPSFIKEKLNL